MQIATLLEPIDTGLTGIIPAGRFIMEDRTVAELQLRWPFPPIKIAELATPFARRLYTEPSETILVAGNIAMGDAIMLTPVLRALKEKHPYATVEVACFEHYRQPLMNLPYVDGFVDWPLEADRLDQYDEVHFLENFMFHPWARTHHLSEVFADMCGVKPKSWKCDYIPAPEELAKATDNFPRRSDRKRLGLQVQASHRCRTYPNEPMLEFMQMMVRDGWEIYLMGAPGEFACQPKGHLHDLRVAAPSFRDSAAFLSTVDAFVGPDSGFLHVAGAMGVKAAGLFAAFPWELRTKNYESVFVLQGAGACAPCYHSPTRLQPAFPATGPCAATGRCEVLVEIAPERIKARVEKLMVGGQPATLHHSASS